ncbi:MAG: PAS domain S-box protein, partial [Burkholderiales bacterium]
MAAITNRTPTARVIAHALGMVVVTMIVASTAWTVWHDRDITLRNAESQSQNVSVVLVEQTRLALGNASPDIREVALAGARAPDAGFDRYFAELYRRIQLGYEGRILLFRGDGVLLATYPDAADAAGRSYSAHPLFSHALKQSEAGTITAPGFVSADERLITYRRVQGYPLIVAVSSARAALLSEWRSGAARAGAVALLLSALGVIGTRLLARQLRINEALTRDVRENEARLQSIISSAMDAMITVDEQQKIVLFNDAAEKIFGCSASEAVGSFLDRFIPERYRATHRQHVQHFGEADATVRRMGAQLVLAGLRSNGEEFPIEASISHVKIAEHKFYTVILRDVSERERALEEQRQAQQQLAETKERLQSIINSAMDAIITVDERQNIILFNAAAERIFRCPASLTIGFPLERLIPERYREAHHAHVARFGQAGITMRRMGGELVLAGLRAGGEEFPIDASISHVTVGGQKFYTVILRDITERQKAAEALSRSHEELRELYEGMHQVREAERTRIARELHDELAQWLTALKMDVSWLGARLPHNEEKLITRVQKMKDVVDSTVAAMRRIAAALRPVMLDDLGVLPAIEHLLHDLSERTGIMVTLVGSEGDADLEEPLATAVYRMVQEALTNVARHSGATSVAVEIKRANGRLSLVVRDNGRGLRPDPNRKSFGVLGIRERARTLGGSANI